VSTVLEPCLSLRRGSAAYPSALQRLGRCAPDEVVAFGPLDLLRAPLLALFSSVSVPGEVVLATLDLARLLRDSGVPVIAGFQSPLERECLTFLLRGRQPLVIAPARAIAGMRIPRAWRPALAAGRLLVLSAARRSRRRISADLAQERNRMIAALAERILVIHATPGGRVHRTALEALAAGKQVFCLDPATNADLLIMGARPLDRSSMVCY
jgi:predicted Rossmann fold nucleotide-binding protein DprA/Smf involved in DNA uptake